MDPLNYASLEASKRLVEAGIVLGTEMIWHREFPDGDIGLELRGHYFQYHEYYPAPSMAEVWRELPHGSQMHQYSGVTYAVDRTGCNEFESNNPTDALIDLLIWQGKETL